MPIFPQLSLLECLEEARRPRKPWKNTAMRSCALAIAVQRNLVRR